MKPRELGVVAALLVAYGISLGRTVEYGYVWDDIPEIAQNPAFDLPLADGIALTQTQRAVPELADLPQLRFGYDSYRPLLFATYWIDIRLWGRDPAPLHAVNVVFGGIAIVIAYALARRWLGDQLAIIPTALFALHPVQIEAVAYVSGRGDVLAGLLAMLSAYAALRAGSRWWIATAAVAFAASLLAKETCIGLPLALAALALARQVRWATVAAVSSVAIAYLGLRAHLVTTSSGPPIGDALISFPGIVLDYLRVVLLPFDLSIERMPRAGYLWAGWALVAAAAVTAIALRKREVPSWLRTTLTGLAWSIALLAPSAIAIATTHVAADRYLYVPLFGAGVAVAAAAARLAAAQPRLTRVLAGAAILWAALVIIVAWRAVPVWRDASTLYRYSAEITPDSSRAQYRVAYLDIERGRWDLAVPRLERAIDLDPSNVPALNNLGVYLLRSQRYPEAESMLRHAVAVNPARFNSWLNLGLAQHEQGKRPQACASIARALAINPGFELARKEHERLCN